MKVTFDLEANGLLDTVTQMWIAVLQPEGGERLTFTFHNNFKGLFKALDDATVLVGHNIIGYDLPLLEKLFNWRPKDDVEIVDTLIMSRLLNPDRKRPVGYPGSSGPHSLDCWGYRVGRYKPSHEEWHEYSSDMLHRCREDVAINVLCHDALLEEWGDHPWDRAYQIETEIAKIITKQELDGVPFDKLKATKGLIDLTLEANLLEVEILQDMPLVPLPESKVVYCPKKPYKNDGTYSATLIRKCGWKLISDPTWRPVAEEPVVTMAPMDLGNAKQVSDYLLSKGWQPTEWNFKKVTEKESNDPESPYYGQQPKKAARDEYGDVIRTSPKLTEDSFNEDLGGIAGLIMKRRTRLHRRNTIKGWLTSVRPDGRLGAGANSLGTNTRRMTHRCVVNVPKPKDKIFYGKEMRSMFYSDNPDYDFVGYDASGLEARMEAHYTYKYDNGAYAKEVLEGDIHTKNMIAFGIDDRDLAKNGKYAITYGCSKTKLASTLHLPESESTELFESFWSANESLASFRDDCKREWNSNGGWVSSIDGGRINIRSQHSIVNAKFQSAGSIVCKLGAIILDKAVKKAGLDCWKAIDMHDEGQYICHKNHTKKLMELMEDCIVQAGIQLNLNVSLAAEAQYGRNWSETH